VPLKENNVYKTESHARQIHPVSTSAQLWRYFSDESTV